VAGLGLFSLGLAVLVAPITAAALSAVPTEQAGIASGVNQTMSRLGGLVATAVVGLVVSLVFEHSGGKAGAVPFAVGVTDPGLRAASIDAFRSALLVCAGLMVAGAILSGLGLPRRGRRPEPAATTRPADLAQPSAGCVAGAVMPTPRGAPATDSSGASS
jgi:hypothetical protein